MTARQRPAQAREMQTPQQPDQRHCLGTGIADERPFGCRRNADHRRERQGEAGDRTGRLPDGVVEDLVLGPGALAKVLGHAAGHGESDRSKGEGTLGSMRSRIRAPKATTAWMSEVAARTADSAAR
jgi:hypothetical protein